MFVCSNKMMVKTIFRVGSILPLLVQFLVLLVDVFFLLVESFCLLLKYIFLLGSLLLLLLKSIFTVDISCNFMLFSIIHFTSRCRPPQPLPPVPQPQRFSASALQCGAWGSWTSGTPRTKSWRPMVEGRTGRISHSYSSSTCWLYIYIHIRIRLYMPGKPKTQNFLVIMGKSRNEHFFW